ncbi:hypothetical protein ACOSP7_026702 [Xanthoceras sorbifolium]
MAVDSKNCVLCVQGATIVEQIVSITPAENYVPKLEMQEVTIVENAVSVAPAENDESKCNHIYCSSRDFSCKAKVNLSWYISCS